MHDACGLFGVCSVKKSCDTIGSTIAGLGLLQHRGLDSCGISFVEGESIATRKDSGLVKDVFPTIPGASTNMCIGHVRYPTSRTSKDSQPSEWQPIRSDNAKLGSFSLAHNGNIPFIEGHDTGYLVKFISLAKSETWEQVLMNLVETIPGVYCLLILTTTAIYVVRDRFGVRPLCIGLRENEFCASSESCALHKFNHYCDVGPGQIYSLDRNGVSLVYTAHDITHNICSFEYLYFLRPNSIVGNLNVRAVRRYLGALLGLKDREKFAKRRYVVTAVPDSGICAGQGYAECLNLSYQQLIKRNLDAKRTFIQPTVEQRRIASEGKFYYQKAELKGKNIIVVDDTIVRGTVMSVIVRQLKECGVNEIHIRIPAPPVKDICMFGIDIPCKEQLICTGRSIEDIREYFGVTSILYLEAGDLDYILPKTACKGCFTSEYNRELLQW